MTRETEMMVVGVKTKRLRMSRQSSKVGETFWIGLSVRFD